MDTDTRIISKGHREAIYTVPSPGQLRGEAPQEALRLDERQGAR